MFGGKVGAKYFLTMLCGGEHAGPALEETALSRDWNQKAPEVQGGKLERLLLLLITIESLGEALLIVLGAALLYLTASYLIQRDSFEIGPLAITMFVYPLPIGIAELRKHNKILDIMIANLWLGWTIIGWMAVLVWACDWDSESGPETVPASSQSSAMHFRRVLT